LRRILKKVKKGAKTGEKVTRMTDVLITAVLLASILLVSILTLAATIRSLLSSRRSEALGENRYELLRDQWDRLEFLREERRTLIEELERQSREREQLMEFLGKTPPQLVEDLKEARREHQEARKRIEDLDQERLRLEQELRHLKNHLERERQGHLESQQRAEQLERQQSEQSGTQQELERLGEERQRLTEELNKEREERLRAQRQTGKHEQERARLERELRSLRAEFDSHRRASTRDRVKESEASEPWWHRPILGVGLLFGAIILWLTSLGVALYLLSP
jgi:chromosome segregation ATPase